MGNFLMVIEPYRDSGTWVFDDERVGLVGEPFVAGIPEMIDAAVADIPDAASGFRLLFAAGPFPGAQIHLERVRPECDGWWYRQCATNIEGWLCPALFKYFDEAPAHLYAKAEPKA